MPPIVKTTPAETELLARLMVAEARGEGKEGMLMVGNVGVNRVIADCSDFKNIRTIQQMVYQSPGGFESVQKGFFYSAKISSEELDLARKVIKGYRIHPATYALWFFNPGPLGKKGCSPDWFGQPFSGRYKNHCFYKPTQKECAAIYRF